MDFIKSFFPTTVTDGVNIYKQYVLPLAESAGVSILIMMLLWCQLKAFIGKMFMFLIGIVLLVALYYLFKPYAKSVMDNAKNSLETELVNLKDDLENIV